MDILFLYGLPDGLVEGIVVIALAGFGAGLTLFFAGFAVRAVWVVVKKFF